MSQLPEYTIGGTLHSVVNNQVAFTTDPKYSRSSPHCTDVAKGINIPVFHVNGDDVEAVARVMELATEWRQRWKTDVVVDIVCYRKYGHNEIDEPMFTQPVMYKKIKQQMSAHDRYAAQLVAEGSMTHEEIAAVRESVSSTLDKAFEESKDYVAAGPRLVGEPLEGVQGPRSALQDQADGREDGNAAQGWQGVHHHPRRVHPAPRRQARVRRAREDDRGGEGVDWAMAEASRSEPCSRGELRASLRPGRRARHLLAPSRADPRPEHR